MLNIFLVFQMHLLVRAKFQKFRNYFTYKCKSYCKSSNNPISTKIKDLATKLLPGIFSERIKVFLNLSCNHFDLLYKISLAYKVFFSKNKTVYLISRVCFYFPQEITAAQTIYSQTSTVSCKTTQEEYLN